MSSSRYGARIQRAKRRGDGVELELAADAPHIRTTSIAAPWILAPEREDDIGCGDGDVAGANAR
jgi:hypothetical protein